MAKKKAGIEIIDETSKKSQYSKDNACPACGAPNGKLACDKCGWGIEELGPDYSIAGGDPVQTLSKASYTFKAVKGQLRELKLQNAALMENNQKFTELVEEMEKDLLHMRMETGRKYVYSYNAGGWGEASSAKMEKLKLTKKKHVTVTDINNQLTEITRLLKRYKK